jgi:hypothetical protein
MAVYTGPVEVSLEPDLDTAVKFLALWFCAQWHGEIEIGAMNPETGKLTTFKRFNFDEIEQAAEYAIEANRVPGVSVYFRPCLIKPGAPYYVTDSDYLRSPGVWSDHDTKESVQHLRDVISTCRPAMVVVTGRHPHTRVQTYRMLEEGVGGAESQKRLNAAVCDHTMGDPAVTNATSLMRLPGTIAWPWKDGRVPEMTELQISDDPKRRAYNEMSILHAFPEKGSMNLIPPGQGQLKPYETGQVATLDMSHPTMNMDRAIRDIRNGNNLHNNARDIAASLAAAGVRDENVEAILTNLLEPVSDGGTIEALPKLISSAKAKFDVKDTPQGQVIVEAEPLPMEWFGDVKFDPLDTQDFVEDTLTTGGMSVIYGDSNVGKTFVAMNLAYSISTGQDWFTKDVDRGAVLYIASEGGGGIRKRIEALKRANPLTHNAAALAIIPAPVDLLDPDADQGKIIDAIKRTEDNYSMAVSMFVVDTLSRAMAGGNENSPEDMTGFVRNVDGVRKESGSHAMIIHHTGKDAAKGSRGHSSLKAATDTEIALKKTGNGWGAMETTKQRDLEAWEEMSFRLVTMELGKNRRDKEVTTCVVEMVDAPAQKRIDGRAGELLDVINNVLSNPNRQPISGRWNMSGGTLLVENHVTRDQIRDLFITEVLGESVTEANGERNISNSQRQALWRATKTLKDRDIIYEHNDLVTTALLARYE